MDRVKRHKKEEKKKQGWREREVERCRKIPGTSYFALFYLLSNVFLHSPSVNG